MEWLMIDVFISWILWFTTLEMSWLSDIYQPALEICMLVLAVLQVIQGKTKS